MDDQIVKKTRKTTSLSLPKRKKPIRSAESPAEKALRTRKRLQYIAILPTTVTLLNAFCGFLSIIYASRGPGAMPDSYPFHMAGISYFALAGYLIVAAMIADLLDGQVARWSGTASSFGGQLDSLSDVLSFGAAPAFLMLQAVEARIRAESFSDAFFFPISLWEALLQFNQPKTSMAANWVLFAAVFFMLCTAIRLARFNAENDSDLSRHQSFAGIPSPAAAGVVVSMVLFLEDYLPGIAPRLPRLSSALAAACIWILPLAAIVCGILMVSRIRYPHLINRLFRKKKSFPSVLLVLFAGFFIAWNIQLAMLLGFIVFAVTGCIRGLYAEIIRIRGKRAIQRS